MELVWSWDDDDVYTYSHSRHLRLVFPISSSHETRRSCGTSGKTSNATRGKTERRSFRLVKLGESGKASRNCTKRREPWEQRERQKYGPFAFWYDPRSRGLVSFDFVLSKPADRRADSMAMNVADRPASVHAITGSLLNLNRSVSFVINRYDSAAMFKKRGNRT